MSKKASWAVWPDVPSKMLQLAKARTAFLMERHPLTIHTFETALANAYLQGMADTAEVSAAVMHRDFQPKQAVNVPDGLA